MSLASDVVRDLTQHIWHGKANRLSRDDPVPWEILDQMEVASWKSSTEQKVGESNHDDSVMERLNPTAYANPYPSQPRAGRVIRQRRSALAFDGKTSISASSFFTMLARVMPRVDRDLSASDALGRAALGPDRSSCPVPHR